MPARLRRLTLPPDPARMVQLVGYYNAFMQATYVEPFLAQTRAALAAVADTDEKCQG